MIPGYSVYITPSSTMLKPLPAPGRHHAVDATQPLDQARNLYPPLIQQTHERLGKPVMGDVDTLDNALKAEAARADCVGTPSFSVTPETTPTRNAPKF